MQRETARAVGVAPWQWRARIAEHHEYLGGKFNFSANRWLFELAEGMQGLRVPIDLGDSEIRAMALDCARRAMSLTEGFNGFCTLPEYRRRLDGFVRGYGIEPPEHPRTSSKGKRVGIEDAPAVKRMTDEHWWRRALRRAQGRALEGWAIKLGYVHRRGEVYASDVTVRRRAEQQRRNAATLEDTSAVNLDTGEVFSLAELAAKGVSNKALRRGELMLRIRGFEEIAQQLGHAAEFWTATCPSRMHAKKVGAGGTADNKKYDGTTPRAAHQYLGKVWARFRAAAARRGLRFYGFRIAEPHHDATPHWHLLLFMPVMMDAGRAAVGRMRALFRRYFLADSKQEHGAKANRCDFKSIDWERGSAAGYIAAYVSKNIDGFQVQGDIEAGCDAVTGSQRVEAWASTWGIRQFQPVGGPPVGVWRELRRMRDTSPDYSPEVEEQRAAADAGNWRRYVELQGGPVKPVVRVDTWQRWGKPTVRKVTRQISGIKRVVNRIVTTRRLKDGEKQIREWVLRVAYTRPGERWCESEGGALPAPLNRYSEIAPGAVFGVRDVRQDRAHVSRFYRWEISRKSGAGGRVNFGVPRTCVNNCTRRVADGKANDVGTGDGAEIRRREGSSGRGVDACRGRAGHQSPGAISLRHGGGAGCAAEGEG